MTDSGKNVENKHLETDDVALDTDKATTSANDPSTQETSDSVSSNPLEKDASYFYHQRKLDKREKELRAEMERKLEEEKRKFAEQVKNGEIPSDVKDDILMEQQMKLRNYELKEFMRDNPEYESHKEAISEALSETKFSGYEVDDIAILVAGKAVAEQRKAIVEAKKHDTVGGASSAGSGGRANDYSKMSREELRIEQNKVRYGGNI